MTFEEYFIEEINSQEYKEDIIDIDDTSIGYSYELDYTIQE